MAIESLREWIELIEGADFAALDKQGIDLICGFVGSLRPHVATFVHRTPVQDVWRVTPNHAVLENARDTRLHQLALLKYPPAEKARYGRANLPGRSVLYGAFSRISPRLETKPVSGDLITLTRWRSGAGTVLSVAPIVFLPEIVAAMPYYQGHYQRFEQWLAGKPDDEARYVREATEFITRQFIKHVPVGRSADYLVSAAFADLLLQDDGIDAVVYPSVATALHDVNIAIKPAVFDGLFEPVEAHEMMVARVSADGSRYHQHHTARADRWDMGAGRVLWDATASVPESAPAQVRDALEQET